MATYCRSLGGTGVQL